MFRAFLQLPITLGSRQSFKNLLLKSSTKDIRNIVKWLQCNHFLGGKNGKHYNSKARRCCKNYRRHGQTRSSLAQVDGWLKWTMVNSCHNWRIVFTFDHGDAYFANYDDYHWLIINIMTLLILGSWFNAPILNSSKGSRRTE